MKRFSDDDVRNLFGAADDQLANNAEFIDSHPNSVVRLVMMEVPQGFKGQRTTVGKIVRAYLDLHMAAASLQDGGYDGNQFTERF